MPELDDEAPGMILRAHSLMTPREGVPVRLDGTEHAERAVEALRSMAADQIDVAFAALRDAWAKVDKRVLHLLEDVDANEIADIASEIEQAARFLGVLAPWIDEDDDDETDPEPEPSPDPSASAGGGS